VPQALLGAVLHCVVEAQGGMSFAGTTRSIFRFDPSRPRSRHFTTHDGLGAHEVLTCGEDAHGRLWFGTTQGVPRYEQFREQRVQSAEVSLAGVRVAGRAVPPSATATRAVRPLKLEPGSRPVEIALSAVDMTAGDTVSVQYRDGGSWSTPSTTADVILAQLPSGAHRDESRALNADGLPGQQIATLDLVVLTAMWQRGWLILTGSGLILISAFFAYRARVRYVLDRERAKWLDADNRELERRIAQGIEKLRQAERMAAYGQMVASVAQEVRHPLLLAHGGVFDRAEGRGWNAGWPVGDDT
jgi:signal transduction histidine kinase